MGEKITRETGVILAIFGLCSFKDAFGKQSTNSFVGDQLASPDPDYCHTIL